MLVIPVADQVSDNSVKLKLRYKVDNCVYLAASSYGGYGVTAATFTQ
jgi:hypothetical protein